MVDPRHVVVTCRRPKRQRSTLYVAPFTSLVGIRIESFEVDPDVKRTADFEAWLGSEIRSRVKRAS